MAVAERVGGEEFTLMLLRETMEFGPPERQAIEKIFEVIAVKPLGEATGRAWSAGQTTCSQVVQSYI